MTAAANPEAGRAFVSLLISEGGREILESYGFSSP
jgi:ABC-type molybdate transport system substrate-binding protein